MGKKKRNSVDNTDLEPINIDTGSEAHSVTVTMRKRRRYAMIAVSAFVALTVVILSVGYAFSWFSPREDADVTVRITDFSTITKYSLSGTDYKTLGDSDEIALNNLNNLKLNIEYTGPSSAYIRVQLFESFKDSDDKLIPAPEIEYTLSMTSDGKGWIEKDGYYYYNQVVTYSGVKKVDGEDKFLSTDIPFVTGASVSTTPEEGEYFNLVSVVEAVQPDRFEDFFGVDPDELFANN